MVAGRAVRRPQPSGCRASGPSYAPELQSCKSSVVTDRMAGMLLPEPRKDPTGVLSRRGPFAWVCVREPRRACRRRLSERSTPWAGSGWRCVHWQRLVDPVSRRLLRGSTARRAAGVRSRYPRVTVCLRRRGPDRPGSTSTRRRTRAVGECTAVTPGARGHIARAAERSTTVLAALPSPRPVS